MNNDYNCKLVIINRRRKSTWTLKVMKHWCQDNIGAGFLSFSECGSLPFPSVKISFVNCKMDSRDRHNPPLNPFLSFPQGLLKCLLHNLPLSLVFLVVIQNSSSGGLLLLLLLLLLFEIVVVIVVVAAAVVNNFVFIVVAVNLVVLAVDLSSALSQYLTKIPYFDLFWIKHEILKLILLCAYEKVWSS